jgi:hypothetical protein
MPAFREFYGWSSLVLTSSEPGSKELRGIVGSEPDDRARSVHCTTTTVGTKPALVFSSCLLPLRWPTARKRLCAPPGLPSERESSTTGHPTGLQGSSRGAVSAAFFNLACPPMAQRLQINWCQGVARVSGKDAPLKKSENGHPSPHWPCPNPLTLLSKNLAGYRLWLRWAAFQ